MFQSIRLSSRSKVVKYLLNREADASLLAQEHPALSLSPTLSSQKRQRKLKKQPI